MRDTATSALLQWKTLKFRPWWRSHCWGLRINLSQPLNWLLTSWPLGNWLLLGLEHWSCGCRCVWRIRISFWTPNTHCLVPKHFMSLVCCPAHCQHLSNDNWLANGCTEAAFCPGRGLSCHYPDTQGHISLSVSKEASGSRQPHPCPSLPVGSILPRSFLQDLLPHWIPSEALPPRVHKAPECGSLPSPNQSLPLFRVKLKAGWNRWKDFAPHCAEEPLWKMYWWVLLFQDVAGIKKAGTECKLSFCHRDRLSRVRSLYLNTCNLNHFAEKYK